MARGSLFVLRIVFCYGNDIVRHVLVMPHLSHDPRNSRSIYSYSMQLSVEVDMRELSEERRDVNLRTAVLCDAHPSYY